MSKVAVGRVAVGTVAGGVVWGNLELDYQHGFPAPKYHFAQAHNLLLAQPRYPGFLVYWFVTLFLLTYILTWVYVSARVTLGPGPMAALRVGLLMGFVMTFPISLALATWATFSRKIVLGWMLDLWVGAILATLVSAWLYKES